MAGASCKDRRIFVLTIRAHVLKGETRVTNNAKVCEFNE